MEKNTIVKPTTTLQILVFVTVLAILAFLGYGIELVMHPQNDAEQQASLDERAE